MVNLYEVYETNSMIEKQNLDVRTITLGISLLDCAAGDIETFNQNIYEKITRTAENLVSTGEVIEKEFGIPIVNKRISITPAAIAAGSAAKSVEDMVSVAKTLDKAAHETGVNFLGGYSAIVSKGMTKAEKRKAKPVAKHLVRFFYLSVPYKFFY